MRLRGGVRALLSAVHAFACRGASAPAQGVHTRQAGCKRTHPIPPPQRSAAPVCPTLTRGFVHHQAAIVAGDQQQAGAGGGGQVGGGEGHMIVAQRIHAAGAKQGREGRRCPWCVGSMLLMEEQACALQCMQPSNEAGQAAVPVRDWPGLT